MPENIINFGRGVPDHSALIGEKPMLLAAEQAAKEKYTGVELLQYGTPGMTSPLGLVGLQELIGLEFAPDVSDIQIAATNGGMEAINFVLLSRRNGPGKPTLIVEAMTYNRVITSALQLGFRVIGIPMMSDGPDLDALEREIINAGRLGDVVFYQVSPHHNPTGVTTPVDLVAEASLICQNYDVIHIVDVAYQQLRYDGQTNELLSLSGLLNTVLVGSFTKTLNPGYKVGFIVWHPDTLPSLPAVIADWRINPVFPAQATLEMAWRSGDYAKHLAVLRIMYAKRAKAMEQALRDHLPETFKFSYFGPINGGAFAVGFVPGLRTADDAAFRTACRKKGVMLEPPIFMTAKALKNFAWRHRGLPYRLPFLPLPPANIANGVERIGEVAKQFTS